MNPSQVRDSALGLFLDQEKLQWLHCMAVCSEAAYHEETSLSGFLYNLHDPETDTQGLILAEDDTLTISVRGTESLRDWITDLKAWKQRFEGLFWGKGHAGVKEAADAIWALLPGVLKEIEEEHNKRFRKIQITGHSLGGGIVVHLIPHLVHYYPGAEVTGAVFGAPCVLGRATAARWNIHYGRFLWRVENSADIVPRVSRFARLYPVGQLIYIDRKGWIFSRAPWWFRFRDKVRRILKPDLEISGLEDHKIDEYIRLVKSAIGRCMPNV